MILVDQDRCIGCGSCVSDCNTKKMDLKSKKAYPREDRHCMLCGHCVAICPTDSVRLSQFDSLELEPIEPGPFPVTPQQLLTAFKRRRSIRQYRDQAVEAEKLDAILSAGAYAPTGGNRRVLRYIGVQGSDAVQNLSGLALAVLNNVAQTTSQEELSRLSLTAYAEKWKQLYQSYGAEGQDGLFYHAPAVLCLIGSVNDRLDAGIAAANMELMCHAQGLGACYIGFFGRAVDADESLKKRLGLKPEEHVLTTLAIGYTDRTYYRTVNRREFQSVEWL